MAQLHPSPPISQGGVRYEIKVDAQPWRCLVVTLGTHLCPTQGKLRLVILQPDGTPLRSAEIELSPEVNNAPVTFQFDPIENSKGKTFTVEFTVNDPTGQSRISLYETQDSGQGSMTQRLYRKLGVSYIRNNLYFVTQLVVVPRPAPVSPPPPPTASPAENQPASAPAEPPPAPFVPEQFPEQSGLPNACVIKKESTEVCLLLPSLLSSCFSGGYNTAFILCAHLARRGVKINCISVNMRADGIDAIRSHIKSLIADDSVLGNFRVTDGCDGTPTQIGENDVIMATAWWTALRAHDILKKTNRKKFIYLIQDFEPLFYGWTTHHAMAMATYGYEYIPVINEEVLAEFFFRFGPGKFSNPGFCRKALVFQPAVDRKVFHADNDALRAGHKKQILFYARPSAPRNLFNMGMVALQQLVGRGVITPDKWEVRLMGDQIAPIDLGNGVILRAIPWMDYAAYARNMREATVGLALMLSPHTSYPPIEMAASGLNVVTTVYSSKSAEKLSRISRNIISVEPDSTSIASGIERAMAASADRPATLAHSSISMPGTWEDAFAPIVDRLCEFIEYKPAGTSTTVKENTDDFVFNDFPQWRTARLKARRHLYAVTGTEPLFSINTTVYDTPVKLIQELESRLSAQDYPHFEWNILDNGSKTAETREYLKSLPQKDRRYKVWRVEQNLHIIGGNRYLLERAQNPYIIPIDSDDLIDTDSLRIFAWHIEHYQRPEILYSDEEKTDAEGVSIEPIFRHGASVLTGFSHCFFSHLSCFKRDNALKAGVYTQDYARGSHDWDTWFRMSAQGCNAVHVPEILYSWRMVATSTAADASNKDYIVNSQRQVLENAVARMELGPLFEFTEDERKYPCYWRWRRKPVQPAQIEILFHVHSNLEHARESLAKILASVADYPKDSLKITVLKRHPGWRTLENSRASIQEIDALRKPEYLAVNDAVAKSSAEIVFVLDEYVYPKTAGWLWQAIGLFELDKKLTVASSRLLAPNDMILTMPRFGGFEGHFAMPFTGIHESTLYSYPRRVGLDGNCSAIAMPWVALRRSNFLALNGFMHDFSGESFGDIEFCLRAGRAGYTTGFTGSIVFGSLKTDCNFGPDPSNPAAITLFEEYADIIRDDPAYHPFISLRAESFDKLESAEQRQETSRRFIEISEQDLLLPRPDGKGTVRYDMSPRHKLRPAIASGQAVKQD